MRQITVRLPEELLAAVEADAEAEGQTRSERTRAVLEARHEAGTVPVEDLQGIARALREREDELADCRRTVERLRNEKRTIIEQREENQELVEYAKEQKSLQRRRHEAGVLTRAKWWLFGGANDETEDRDGRPERTGREGDDVAGGKRDA